VGKVNIFATRAATGFPTKKFVAPFDGRPFITNGAIGRTRFLQGNLAGAAVSTLARRAPADLRLPCMVYAAIAAVPRGTDATDLDLAGAGRSAGVVNVIAYDGVTCDDGSRSAAGIAVVARGYWLARKTLARLLAQWVGAPCTRASDYMAASLARSLGAHADAPAHCTTQLVDGHLRLWFATKEPARSRAAAAQLAGIAEALVDLCMVHVDSVEAGMELLAPAITLARALQPAPVQVIGFPELLALHRVSPARSGRADATAPGREASEILAPEALAA
jgi:hypothetical protein